MLAQFASRPTSSRSIPTPQCSRSRTGDDTRRRGAKYKRANSLRYPSTWSARPAPPEVERFSLHFHCEVDYRSGRAYGSGGALLSTIRRVIRQLTRLQRLVLTDLFLSPADARQLILDLHVVSTVDSTPAQRSGCCMILVHAVPGWVPRFF